MNTEYLVVYAERGASVLIIPAHSVIANLSKKFAEVRNATNGELIAEISYLMGGRYDVAQTFQAARNTAIAWGEIWHEEE